MKYLCLCRWRFSQEENFNTYLFQITYIAVFPNIILTYPKIYYKYDKRAQKKLIPILNIAMH